MPDCRDRNARLRHAPPGDHPRKVCAHERARPRVAQAHAQPDARGAPRCDADRGHATGRGGRPRRRRCGRRFAPHTSPCCCTPAGVPCRRDAATRAPAAAHTADRAASRAGPPPAPPPPPRDSRQQVLLVVVEPNRSKKTCLQGCLLILCCISLRNALPQTCPAEMPPSL